MSRLFNLSATAAAAVLALAGCSGDESGGSSDGNGDGGVSVEIVQPADGDSLEAPFTFVVDSSEELGPTDSGAHHVHVSIDGNEEVYEVVESGNGEEHEIAADSPIFEGLEPGEHTLDVSLRNADHSPAGAEDQITITIGEGGGSGEGDDPGGY